MTHETKTLVKLLREGWRGGTATDLMTEAADVIARLSDIPGEDVSSTPRTGTMPDDERRELARRLRSVGNAIGSPLHRQTMTERGLVDAADLIDEAADALEEPRPVTDAEHLVDKRDPECVKVWPGCHSFGYDPACCRFPKSCSAGGWELEAVEAARKGSTTNHEIRSTDT